MPDAQAPAGGVSSNVVDLVKWLRLQLAGGSLDGGQIVDEDALDQTHTPMIMKSPPSPTIADPATFYGLGWNIDVDDTGAIRWNHSGAFSVGASTTAKLLPGADLGIVVLTNGEPIGVPEAITDAYFELVQTGEVTQDWIEIWGERFSGLYGPTEDWSTPPTDAAPAAPDESYVGTYRNDYVGDVDVVAVDGGLVIVEGPQGMEFPLEHWDGNTFIYPHDAELPDYRSTVIFDIGSDGVASAVTIDTFDSSGLGTLLRVSP